MHNKSSIMAVRVAQGAKSRQRQMNNDAQIMWIFYCLISNGLLQNKANTHQFTSLSVCTQCSLFKYCHILKEKKTEIKLKEGQLGIRLANHLSIVNH